MKRLFLAIVIGLTMTLLFACDKNEKGKGVNNNEPTEQVKDPRTEEAIQKEKLQEEEKAVNGFIKKIASEASEFNKANKHMEELIDSIYEEGKMDEELMTNYELLFQKVQDEGRVAKDKISTLKPPKTVEDEKIVEGLIVLQKEYSNMITEACELAKNMEAIKEIPEDVVLFIEDRRIQKKVNMETKDKVLEIAKLVTQKYQKTKSEKDGNIVKAKVLTLTEQTKEYLQWTAEFERKYSTIRSKTREFGPVVGNGTADFEKVKDFTGERQEEILLKIKAVKDEIEKWEKEMLEKPVNRALPLEEQKSFNDVKKDMVHIIRNIKKETSIMETIIAHQDYKYKDNLFENYLELVNLEEAFFEKDEILNKKLENEKPESFTNMRAELTSYKKLFLAK